MSLPPRARCRPAACWASNNCAAAARKLQQQLLPCADDSFKLLHELEQEHLQVSLPPQLLQQWERAVAVLLQDSAMSAAAGAAEPEEEEQPLCSAAPDEVAAAAEAAISTRSGRGALAVSTASSSVVPFTPRQRAAVERDNSSELFSLMASISQQQPVRELAGAR